MDSFKKNYSEFYDTLYLKKNYKREFNLIKNLIRKYLKKPRSLLDLGCGTGKYSYLLTKLNLKVVGLDRSKFMIKIAKKCGVNSFEKSFLKVGCPECVFGFPYQIIVFVSGSNLLSKS